MTTNQGRKAVQIDERQHYRLRLLAAKHGLKMNDVIYRALDLYEAQTELPHPTDATPVKVVYIQEDK